MRVQVIRRGRSCPIVSPVAWILFFYFLFFLNKSEKTEEEEENVCFLKYINFCLVLVCLLYVPKIGFLCLGTWTRLIILDLSFFLKKLMMCFMSK